jgi:hypothetical protein
LDTEFCLLALERAIGIAKPEIFNPDQGDQFSNSDFTSRLGKEDIAIRHTVSGLTHNPHYAKISYSKKQIPIGLSVISGLKDLSKISAGRMRFTNNRLISILQFLQNSFLSLYKKPYQNYSRK